MTELPAEPVSPREFMEQLVPGLLSAASSVAGVHALDGELAFGVRLDGEGGGEWVVRWSRESVTVVAEPRGSAAITWIQTVEDWRGTLWGGRGGVFGRRVTALLRRPDRARSGPSPGGASARVVMEQLASLDGVIRIRVTGGTGGDWATAIKLGPGDIPVEPTTTVSVSASDAEALARGELDPLQAFMSGRIRVTGDMALVMQIQVIGDRALR